MISETGFFAVLDVIPHSQRAIKKLTDTHEVFITIAGHRFMFS